MNKLLLLSLGVSTAVYLQWPASGGSTALNLKADTRAGLALPKLPGAGVPAPAPTPAPSAPGQTPAAPTGVVRFVAFGDAGQATGTGPAIQTAVGNAMADVCAERGCDFALEFGDNFYLSGVSSTTDSQWKTKFEDPYARLNIPVFATLGNHDNSNSAGEGSNNARGDVQVAYHAAAENTSRKWNMPSRYYRFTAPLARTGNDFAINHPNPQVLPEKPVAPVVEFFSLDSSPLTAIVADPAPQWNFLTYGPQQLQWYQRAVMASKAPWKIAFAHHPYISNGLHGNAGSYDGSGPIAPLGLPLTATGQPWLEFHNDSTCRMGVDFYMFGHDHDIEWLEPVSRCGKTQFVLSGAAEQPRPFGDANRNKTYFQKDNVLAFFWFEFRADRMIGTAYVLGPDMKLQRNADGTLVKAFEKTVMRP